MARRDQAARAFQARREDSLQATGDRVQAQFRIVRRPLALDQVQPQLPVDAETRLQTQGRGRGLMLGRSRAKKDYRSVAALGAHLRPPDLFLTRLRHPAQDHACGVGLAQLLDGPQPLERLVRVDPHQMPFVEPQMDKSWNIRGLGRPDHHDLLALRNQGAHRGCQKTPLEDGRLHLEHLGQRTAGPPAAGQLRIQCLEAAAENTRHRAAQGVSPPERGFHRMGKHQRAFLRVARRRRRRRGRGEGECGGRWVVATHPRQGGGHAGLHILYGNTESLSLCPLSKNVYKLPGIFGRRHTCPRVSCVAGDHRATLGGCAPPCPRGDNHVHGAGVKTKTHQRGPLSP